MNRSYLPDHITLKTGERLFPVIGGSLHGIPFLTTVDTSVNGWANGITDSQERTLIIEEAKRQKRKYRRVNVMSGRLRGKRDLVGLPYRASVFIFVEFDGV